jgi:hypothetical protein
MRSGTTVSICGFCANFRTFLVGFRTRGGKFLQTFSSRFIYLESYYDMHISNHIRGPLLFIFTFLSWSVIGHFPPYYKVFPVAYLMKVEKQ